MWLSLRPKWFLLGYHMYTDWPEICSYADLNDRLYVNLGRNAQVL